MTAPQPVFKDVIVTGGTGFIGHTLAQRLTKEVTPDAKILAPGSRVVDLADRDATFRWFERHHLTHEISHIFHLAALYKAGGWPATHPATQFHANMAININLLEAWKRYFPKARLVNVVSYCMYPDHDRPHPESEMYGTEPEEYLYAYAFTKKALIIGQRAYCQEFGLSAVSVVLPTVYGPRDSFTEDSHVMGALIGKFSNAVRNGRESVEVWGDGRQEREFLHVDDAVDGIVNVGANAGLSHPVFNLGAGVGMQVGRIAEIIKEATGFTGEIRYNKNRFVGAFRRVLSTELVRSETGWMPRISIEVGIRRTVEFHLKRLTHEQQTR